MELLDSFKDHLQLYTHKRLKCDITLSLRGSVSRRRRSNLFVLRGLLRFARNDFNLLSYKITLNEYNCFLYKLEIEDTSKIINRNTPLTHPPQA